MSKRSKRYKRLIRVRAALLGILKLTDDEDVEPISPEEILGYTLLFLFVGMSTNDFMLDPIGVETVKLIGQLPEEERKTLYSVLGKVLYLESSYPPLEPELVFESEQRTLRQVIKQLDLDIEEEAKKKR